jgi:hypothetical protein
LLECRDVGRIATVRVNKIGVGSCEDDGNGHKDVFEFASSWVARGQEPLESLGVATQLRQW